MAKELPYFRFTVSEWLNDDISLEDYHTKGVFIDVCSYYWFKDCSITLAMLEKRFINVLSTVEQLRKLDIIKSDSKANVRIDFLDEQYDLLSEKRKKRQIAGQKGGKQRASNAQALLNQGSSYKDKDNNKDNDNNKYKDNTPSFIDFKNYALEKKSNIDLDHLKLKFDSWIENDWKDGNNKKIKNWKSKLNNTIPYIKEKENQGSQINWDKI